MKRWKSFEKEATDFLTNKFGDHANFICKGGSDSTISDIWVKSSSGKEFYIDAKLSPAQCGQFVLIPDSKNKKFQYSKSNTKTINEYSEEIICYMNNNFETFCKSDTKGTKINIKNDQNIFSNWIIQEYKNKGTEFFITNNFTILPVDDIKKHFDISAKYRVKRSGSSNPSKMSLNKLSEYIENKFYKINNVIKDNGKLFVTSSEDIDKQKFYFEDNEYMFANRKDKYEVRKLSKTTNANVIFQIFKKENIEGLSEKEFLSFLH